MLVKVNGYFFRLLVTVLAVCMVSCSRGAADEPAMLVEDEFVTLAIDAFTLDAFVYAENELPAVEKMCNLRIIVLSRDYNGSEWTVEHNDYIAYDSPVLRDKKRYKVKRNTLKRVYLIANSVGHGFNDAAGGELDLSDGASYLPVDGGNAPVDDATFVVGDMEGGLPMSALFEIYVNEVDVTGSCHIVRAVNKLTLTLRNKTVDDGASDVMRDIRLVDWSIDNIADVNYIMPHVTKGPGGYRVIDTDRTTELHVSDWVEWLVDEACKREEGDVERYQWLSDYAVPAGAVHGKLTEQADGSGMVGAGDDAYTHGTVYFAESRYNPSALGLQEYTLTLHTEERDAGDSQWTRREYKAVLPQLVSLFRNTHLMINVAIGKLLVVTVEEQPYASVKLDPVFGLDRDENGEIIK